MNSYNISVKLILEYLYKNTMEFTKQKRFTFELYEFKEPTTNSTITINPDFEITFCDLICADDDKAIIIVENLLQDICKKLTIIIQLHSAENEECQPILSYDISKIKIINKIELYQNIDTNINNNSNDNNRTITFVDKFCIKEHMSITVSHELPLKEFSYVFFRNSTFFMDILYRALRCRDVLSKYFTLFTMIEFIESTYSNKLQFHKIVDKSNTHCFKKFVDETFPEVHQKEKERLVSRVNSILCNATVETRAEKLCKIIKNIFQISSITKALVKYDITPEKMQQFIEMRNQLFHGGGTHKENHNLQIQTTNELLFLCLKIIEFDAKNNNDTWC